MQFTFAILSLILIFYTLKRRLDFLSIASLSFVIYHSHALYGELWIHSRERADYLLYSGFVTNELYYVLFGQLLTLLVVMHIYDAKSSKRTALEPLSERCRNRKGEKRTFTIMTCLFMSLFLIDIASVGVGNLSASKSEVWQSLSIFYILTLWMALATFLYGLVTKRPTFILLSLIPLLTHLFIGSRAYFATMLALILLLHSDRIRGTIFARNAKVFGFGLVAVFTLQMYKSIYLDVKSFDFQQIISKLTNVETWAWAVRLGEPRIILSNYNFILEEAVRFDATEIVGRFFSVIPFLNRLSGISEEIRLSSVLKDRLSAKYGLGTSFWAEGYAMFGYFGIFLLFFIWLYFLAKANRYLINLNRSFSCYFMVPLAAYLSFYIHRMDLIKVIGNIKFLLFAVFVWWIINSSLTGNWSFWRVNRADRHSSNRRRVSS